MSSIIDPESCGSSTSASTPCSGRCCPFSSGQRRLPGWHNSLPIFSGATSHFFRTYRKFCGRAHALFFNNTRSEISEFSLCSIARAILLLPKYNLSASRGSTRPLFDQASRRDFHDRVCHRDRFVCTRFRFYQIRRDKRLFVVNGHMGLDFGRKRAVTGKGYLQGLRFFAIGKISRALSKSPLSMHCSMKAAISWTGPCPVTYGIFKVPGLGRIQVFHTCVKVIEPGKIGPRFCKLAVKGADKFVDGHLARSVLLQKQSFFLEIYLAFQFSNFQRIYFLFLSPPRSFLVF